MLKLVQGMKDAVGPFILGIASIVITYKQSDERARLPSKRLPAASLCSSVIRTLGIAHQVGGFAARLVAFAAVCRLGALMYVRCFKIGTTGIAISRKSGSRLMRLGKSAGKRSCKK